MTAFNGYPFSIMLALLIHGLILGSFLVMGRADSEVLEVVRPPAVKALLVEENPQARNQQVLQQRADQQRQREEQVRQENQRQEQARQEQARQEQAVQEQAARAEAAQQEQQRQAVLRQQREQQEAEQQREREITRQQEVARQQEAERQQQEAQRQEQQRQSQADAAAQAAAEASAREQAETESEIVMAYTAVIHDLVQRNWSRPPSARNNMTAVLRIRLVPTGDVVDVEIVRSSGDAAFDRAAETAVRAVGRFSELQGMPPRIFERSFRSLLLTFRPEDLLN